MSAKVAKYILTMLPLTVFGKGDLATHMFIKTHTHRHRERDRLRNG